MVQNTAREQAAKYEGSVCEALIEEVNEESSTAENGATSHDSKMAQNGEIPAEDKSRQMLVTGRLSNNMIVHVPGDASLVGKVVRVSLDECKGFYYLGKVL